MSTHSRIKFNRLFNSTAELLRFIEIKSRLKSGNVCYHSVQKCLSSSLPTKNFKFKIYKTIILSVVLYGRAVYLLYKISKEYNLEIATGKTKVFGFVGTDHLREK